MPTFDFTQHTPQQEAVGGQVSDRGAQITGQAQRNIGSAVTGFGDTLFKISLDQRNEEDEADMVGARSAMLRLQQQESQELRATSNPDEMDKIHGKYGKQYDSIVSGSDPAFGNPYFRNETGKDRFKQNFVTGFNDSRAISKEEQKFELNRKNTEKSYYNGIQSVRDSDYVFEKQAEVETNQYVDKLVNANFMTNEDGVEFKRKAMLAIDGTRANKALSTIEMIPFEGEGEGLQALINNYKGEIDDLKYLNESEKNDYKKTADNLFKSKKSYNKAGKAELKRHVETEYNNTYSNYMLGIAKGDISLEEASKNSNLKPEDQTKFINEYNKQRQLEASTKIKSQEALKSQFNKEETISAIYAYEPSKDPLQTKRTELTKALVLNVSDAPTRKMLADYLEKGNGVPPHMVEERKAESENLDRIFGFTEASKELYKKDPWGMAEEKLEVKDGIEYVDGVSLLDRRKAHNNILMQYDSLIREGKISEAKTYIKDESVKWEKSQNDTKLMQNFFSVKKTYK